MGGSLRNVVSLPFRIFQWAVDIAFGLAIFGFACLFTLQFLHSPKLEHLNWIVELKRIGNPVIRGVASWVKTDWPTATGFSFIPLGMVFATWLVKIGADATFLPVYRLIEKLGRGKQAARMSPSLSWTGSAAVVADSERARAELLRRYRQIEEVLKSAERKQCTFLSIDVVDSSRIKVGEKETNIAATFQAYEDLLKNVFSQYSAWKQAWTPDGVMACFLQAELAVEAAKRLLAGMKEFNKTENRLRETFEVRCGLNKGEIAIYEDSKLEKITDRIIDIAGHMQKNGWPNTLSLSKEIYAQLDDPSGFQPLHTEVDGLEVWQWTPPANSNPS